MSKKFGTLRDLRGSEADRDRDSGEDSEGEGQSFFVGGSETSGQQVIGPGRGRPNVDADRLFNLARRAGAETVQPGENESTSSRNGGGVRLGDGVAGSAPVAPAGAPEEEVPVTMVAYENGFTLNGGEFRAFEDPANAHFLQDISRGQIPRELFQQYGGRKINLKMERKAGEYEAPKVRIFGGEGARLGAVVPEVVGVDGAPSALPAASAPSKDEAAKLQESAQASVSLDESQPTTQIQIRLPDGRRVVGRFNTNAIVREIRNFVTIASPAVAFGPFELRTAYPNAAIDDEDRSLSDAALLNAVVIVKQTA